MTNLPRNFSRTMYNVRRGTLDGREYEISDWWIVSEIPRQQALVASLTQPYLNPRYVQQELAILDWMLRVERDDRGSLRRRLPDDWLEQCEIVDREWKLRNAS